MKKTGYLLIVFILSSCINSEKKQISTSFDNSLLIGKWELWDRKPREFGSFEITKNKIKTDNIKDSIYYFEYSYRDDKIIITDLDSIKYEWNIEKLDSNRLTLFSDSFEGYFRFYNKLRTENYDLSNSIMTELLLWLGQMNENYSPQERKTIDSNEGIFFRGIKNLTEEVPNNKSIENVDRLFEADTKIERSYLKGNILHKGYLHYMFNLEEYIFNTEKQATHLKGAYYYFKNPFHDWDDIDKNWNDIIQVDNRIIYLSGEKHYPNEMKKIKNYLEEKIYKTKLSLK